MGTMGIPPDPVSLMENTSPVKELLEELRAGLWDYWKTADRILLHSGVRLHAPQEEDFALKKNFFSLLFLYSFYRADIPKPRRVLYAATLQCLRGMVTGCDNLLDDEYKKTLDTDLPETAYRFRSVMDILVSDRVLFQLLLEACARKEIHTDQVTAAMAASIKTMTLSGRQEASEELGITEILPPDELLRTVHHYKTGILFTCPWDIPLCIENREESEIKPLKEGLYRIGMGCQVMDDMVDFVSDLHRKRHNYMVSLIYYSTNPDEKALLEKLISAPDRAQSSPDMAGDFPENTAKGFQISQGFLESGLNLLFSPRHSFLVKPSIAFLKKRIGVNRLSECNDNEI